MQRRDRATTEEVVTNDTAAWVVRTGKHGERDAWALESGFTGGGWLEIPDLTPATSRDDVGRIAQTVYGTESPASVANVTGQLYALRSRIKPGDLMVLPLKTTSQIAFGRVADGYRYLSDNDPTKRHVIPVQWMRTDLPRTAVGKDLLFTLGSALTIFQATKNDAVRRLEALAATGVDPGATTSAHEGKRGALPGDGDAELDSPEWNTDIETVARDRIAAHILQRYAGHGMADIVTAILTVDGFHCITSPPGADGGIDVHAGRGPLGLDSPKLLVQVKSDQSPIGAPIVTQLHGVMGTHGADQGLLVAWGGLTRPARDALKNHHFRVRIWDADDIVDAVIRTYDRLPEAIRSGIPLKPVWILVNTEG
jgi:restriction system protein